MPTRISNYASQQTLNSYLNTVRQRLNETQIQMTSEQRSQDYIGIGRDTQRLVGYEVDIKLLDNYKRGNDIQDIHMQATETALTGIEETIKEFRQTLVSFNTATPTDANSINTIQQQAFRSLEAMQSYLNIEVNGRHLFSGNRTNTSPVDLGLTTLADFQIKYDGLNKTYPTTRDSLLENYGSDQDSAGRTDWLTFTQDNDGNATTAGTSTITSTTAQFSNLDVGSIFTVSGTANNNGSYEVAAITNGGTTIEVTTSMLTNENNSAIAKLTNTDGTVLTNTDFTDVTFNRSAGTIVASTAGSLVAMQVGDSFVVSGSTANDGTYFVESNDGTTLKIRESKLVDEGSTSTVSSLTGQDFTFTNGTSAIDAAAGTPFSSVTAGMKVTFGGTTNNNQTYTVATVVGGGTGITVVEPVTTEAPAGSNDTALITVTTPTLDIVNQSFTYTNNAATFDTIDSGVAGTFSSLTTGMKITTTGAVTVGNNATYTIASVSTDGSSISVLETVTTEAPAGTNDTAVVSLADGTIASDNYYNGDTFTHTHRLSETRDFTVDLTALDPAFEKAIRAMANIAQGRFGTVGGLEQTANTARITTSINLIDLSLTFNNSANPEFDASNTNSIEQAMITVGYQRSLLDTVNTEHTRLVGFFESRVAELETVDLLDVTTRLLDDQRALEASYKAMAAIRSLSLHNFL